MRKDKSGTPKNKPVEFSLPVTAIGSRLAAEYRQAADFFTDRPDLDFLHFDYATTRELALCTFFKPSEQIRGDGLIKDFEKEMPYLLGIFKHPLIHLKETDDIQPVEMVKRVNHNTIRHLSLHAENWRKQKGGAAAPAKLLTKIYDDNYGIYENIVFRDLIDKFLVFLKKRIYEMSEISDAFNESVRLDAFSRIDHQAYYLAVGKLYAGFSKTENSSEVAPMLENARRLYTQLNKRKASAVYAKNVNVKPIAGDIKKTNIFTMHKDYKRVYSLYQKFKAKTLEPKETGNPSAQAESQKNYSIFCQMLVLFAASNFNMTCKPESAVFTGGKLNARLEFKDWRLTLSYKSIAALDFGAVSTSFKNKGGEVKFLIIPMSYYIAQNKKRHYEYLVEKLYRAGAVYDKYVFFEPFGEGGNPLNNYSIKHPAADADLFYAVLPVSIWEINSFRRVQKLLLEGMVRSAPLSDVCAFCGGAVTDMSDGKRLCQKCRTAVKTVNCGCGKSFTAAYIDIKKVRTGYKTAKDAFVKEMPDFLRQEKLYRFRNIVNMSEGKFICPYCGEEND